MSTKPITLTLVKEKEVKHSVRYMFSQQVSAGREQVQFYVPKWLLLQMGHLGIWPKELEVTLETKEKQA